MSGTKKVNDEIHMHSNSNYKCKKERYQSISKIHWIETSQKNKERTSLQKRAENNEFYVFCCHFSCNVSIYSDNKNIIR